MTQKTFVLVSASVVGDNDIRPAIEQFAPDATVRVPWNGEQAVDYAQQAVDQGATHVVAIGGDGTVSAAARACAGRRATLGVVPRGTANDFAFALGLLELDDETQMSVAFGNRTRVIDALWVNDVLCVNALSVGDGARITHETSGGLKDALGPLGYAFAGVKDMGTVVPFHAVMTAEEWKYEGETYMIVIANGNRAGGVVVHPHADLDDGLLDVLVFPNVPDVGLLGLASQVPKLAKGTFEHLQVFQAAEVTLRMATQQPMSLDGEYQEASSVEIRVAANALEVAVPE